LIWQGQEEEDGGNMNTRATARAPKAARRRMGRGEYARYHHGGEGGKEEAHIEPAILYQPLGEASSVDGFGEEWRRIFIEEGSSRCVQYGGHWKGRRCVGIPHHGGTPKCFEKAAEGAAGGAAGGTIIPGFGTAEGAVGGALGGCLIGIAEEHL
jgi:hypothetical protein